MQQAIFLSAALPLPAQILLWVAGILLFAAFMWVLFAFVASKIILTILLCRTSPEKWTRTPNFTEEAYLKMDREGMAWATENAHRKQEVHIQSNGLNLYGEYFDFGSDRCVMILSGRTESLRYGYYFAQPYAKAGCNVLVIDPRAHGLSDGSFNTAGFEESRDDLAWAAFLHDTLGVRSIILHGICIGAAGGMYAITSEDCPPYIHGIVTDGMFPNFGESIKNHLIERKKPVFLVYDCMHFWFKHYTGHSFRFGPIHVIDRLNKPLLMIHSREDLYSTPAYAQKLYELAGTPDKELVWFEHGAHSMLRVTDTARYDQAIQGYLERHFGAVAETASSKAEG